MEAKYTYWEDEGWYVGYLDKYPDNWTQGKTRAELEEMLADLYEILKGDEARNAAEQEKKTGTLTVATA
jgi:predicted RNase H-like HicB family nuclease